MEKKEFEKQYKSSGKVDREILQIIALIYEPKMITELLNEVPGAVCIFIRFAFAIFSPGTWTVKDSLGTSGDRTNTNIHTLVNSMSDFGIFAFVENII